MVQPDSNSNRANQPTNAPENPVVAAGEKVGSHILIIDDSNRICSLLVSSIVRECAGIQRSCSVVQSSDLGLIETIPMNFSPDPLQPSLTIYTANSPRHAVPVLKLTHLQKLTIICDIIMPSDTTVGLFGLLREISHSKLLVNLVFASSEGQNRVYVEQLIKYGKAYFLEKGSQAWVEIPAALVRRSELFQFKQIVRSDYDYGRLPEEESYRRTGRLQAPTTPPPTPNPPNEPPKKPGGFWKKS